MGTNPVDIYFLPMHRYCLTQLKIIMHVFARLFMLKCIERKSLNNEYLFLLLSLSLSYNILILKL